MMQSIRITKRLIVANIRKAKRQGSADYWIWVNRLDDLLEFERESKTDRD